MLSSYSDVFGIVDDHSGGEDILVGDQVRTGSNLFPHFEVLAVHGDKVWVRNIETGADALTQVARCRKVETQVRLAAE